MAFQRTTGSQQNADSDEVGELRAKLVIREALSAAFDELRDEAGTIEIIARLATRDLAEACWIFTSDASGELRLAFGPQSGVSESQPEMPDQLPKIVARLGRTRRMEVHRAGSDTSLLVLPL